MTKEELKEHCKKQVESCEMWAKAKGEEPHGKVYEEHKLILELLEQEPCEDAISRQALYEWIDGWKEKNKYYHPHTKNEIIPICEVIDIIQSLPSVTQKADDVLDKIRAEIMDFEEELFHRPNADYSDYAAVRHCVEIIDKHKAESEDKE